MMRRGFGRLFGSRLLIGLVAATLLSLGVTACGASRPILATQTAVRGTEIAPTPSQTPYATAPGGNNTTPAAGGVTAAAQAAGSAAAGSAVVGTASAMAGTPAAGMATPTPTVRR